MIKLWLVWRKYTNLHDSVIGAFLVESHARQFARECEVLGKHAGIRIEESHVSTYGMSEVSRQALIHAVNSIVYREGM